MTWYTDAAKTHWLAKVDELGDRFNPDCGNNMDRYGIQGPPFEMLINKFGSFKWAEGEKQFGIPRWVLEVVSMYMHEVHPRKAEEIVRTMFETVPTYTDLEPMRHKFALYLLMRGVGECGWYACSLANKTKPIIHVAESLAPAIVQHQLCLQDPKYVYNEKTMKVLDAMMEDVMMSFNGKEEAIRNLVTCCQNGWTSHAISALRTLNELCGNDVGTYEDGYAAFHDEIYNHMLSILRGE
ncbi:hypothetical protein VPHD81_0100 [Vibrio phage D81]